MVNVAPSDSALPALPVPEAVYRAPELEINRTARRMEWSVLGTFSQAELASTPAKRAKDRSRSSDRRASSRGACNWCSDHEGEHSHSEGGEGAGGGARRLAGRRQSQCKLQR